VPAKSTQSQHSGGGNFCHATTVFVISLSTGPLFPFPTCSRQEVTGASQFSPMMSSPTVLSPVSSQSSTVSPARRGTINRSMTAPDKMNVNGHFASAGQNGKADFEHGIQVIDEDKEFKYATKEPVLRPQLRFHSPSN
jgi:hypothetical protein